RQAQPAGSSTAHENAIVGRVRQLCADVQACRHSLQLEPPADSILDEIGKCAAPLAVDLAHSSNVTRKMSLLEEISERDLIEARGAKSRDERLLSERVDERLRHDQVAEAERGKENLAERADVDDAACPVEAPQRRQRRALVPELAVVIVLEDPRIGLRG